MARPRLELYALLKGLIGDDKEVYYQRPTGTAVTYPCIIYKRDDEQVRFANNRPYNRTRRYQVTVIDPNPDSPIAELVGDLPMCVFDRQFPTKDLNHTVFKIFF